MLTDRFAMEDIKETAMVDIAYDLLKNRTEPIMYQDIMNEVATLKGFTEDEVEKYIAQLYTAINIDGRFTCVGRGLWGLKDWYPIDQTTESAVAGNIKDDYSDEDLDSLYDEEPDLYRDDDAGSEIDDLDDDLEDAVVEDDEETLLEEVEEVEGLEEALEVEGEDLDDDFDEEEEFEEEELDEEV